MLLIFKMKKICTALISVLMILFFSAVSYAFDAEADAELRVIDSEISSTNYNQALLLLKEFIEKNPDYFDYAQERIKKIMLAREKYAALSKELIDVILNEPENNQKKLAIIEQLQTLEKRPSPATLAFIAEAKSAAQFTYYRAIFNRLMSEGSELVAKQKYFQAVETFHKGFELYQFDFFNNTLDENLTEPVRKSIADMERMIPSYEFLQKSLDSACKEFIKAVKSGNYFESISAFGKVQTEFSSFAKIRNEICMAGVTVDSVFAKMKEENPKLTDSSFLPFLSRFTFGRPSNPDTGILGAMDAQWNILVEEMKHAVYVLLAKKSAEFEKSVRRQNVFVHSRLDKDVLTSIQNFAELGISVNRLYASRANRQGEFEQDFCPEYNKSMWLLSHASQNIDFQLGLISAYRKAVSDKLKYSRPENAASQFRLAKNDYVENLLGLVPVFEKISTDSQLLLNSQVYRDLQNTKIAANENSADERVTPGIAIKDEPLDWDSCEKILYFLCSNATSLAEKQAVENWQDIAGFFASSGTEIAGEYESQYAWASHLISESSENKISPEGKSFEPGMYPEEALNLVIGLEKSVLSDRKLLENALKTLEGGKNYKNSFAESQQAVENSIARLDALGITGNDVKRRSNQSILFANSARNEGDLRYSQAVQAAEKNNFITARDYLQRARAKYNESLSYQMSVELRNATDQKLIALGELIAGRENTVVVAEVRKLKNQARNAYYSGDFENAEKLLVRAKTRWSATNIEEDAEITSLMTMVITALSIQSGRVILPTAPLYPEMSQILSIANQFYDEGRALIEKRQFEEGRAILIQAKEKLRELQLVYPLNQEASLLTLRIDKLIDEKSFQDMFTRRINNARRDYRNPEKRQTAYTDLLDLYTINPAYPGLAKLINDVEIEIGIKPKPVDKSALKRSKTLTDEVQAIVNQSRDEIELKKALSMIDTAISLNPQNEQAILLKDRIQIAIGGKATVVLSAEDEMRYQKAIQELQNNNIIEAYALVQRLLQSAKNKRSPKILDLQKKIQALL